MSEVVIGGGAFGTAVGAALATSGRQVVLLVRDSGHAESINRTHINVKYLPDFRLPNSLTATTTLDAIREAKTLFLAVPARSIDSTCRLLSDLNAGTRVVNLAKGLHSERLTLNRAVAALLPQTTVCALKGPTFARPLMQGAPSGMTLAAEDPDTIAAVAGLFTGTHIRLDQWKSVDEVEFISAVKNILAIAMGICDAIEDNPNTRFLVMQRIINEAHSLLRNFDFNVQVLFTFAGLGDLLMTALNDTSRNRTLGLLLGRGFDLAITENGPVLEGKRSVSVIRSRLHDRGLKHRLISSLSRVFDRQIGPQDFYNEITGPL